jgi:hypothetical protein
VILSFGMLAGIVIGNSKISCGAGAIAPIMASLIAAVAVAGLAVIAFLTSQAELTANPQL